MFEATTGSPTEEMVLLGHYHITPAQSASIPASTKKKPSSLSLKLDAEANPVLCSEKCGRTGVTSEQRWATGKLLQWCFFLPSFCIMFAQVCAACTDS